MSLFGVQVLGPMTYALGFRASGSFYADQGLSSRDEGQGAMLLEGLRFWVDRRWSL